MMPVGDLDALILCGGLGTRLRTAVGDTQKVLAEVQGQPFLDRVLGHLRQQGLRRVVLATGYQAQQVEDYYRRAGVGLQIEFSRETEPLGTGGAVRRALPLLRSDPFFVLNGDSFCPVNFSALLQFHEQRRPPATIVVAKPAVAPAEADYGLISLDPDQRIRSFQEKAAAASGWCNAGVYCLSSSMAAALPERDVFSLEYDVFPSLAGQACGFPTGAVFLDIGTPERFLAAQSRPEEKKE